MSISLFFPIDGENLAFSGLFFSFHRLAVTSSHRARFCRFSSSCPIRNCCLSTEVIVTHSSSPCRSAVISGLLWAETEKTHSSPVCQLWFFLCDLNRRQFFPSSCCVLSSSGSAAHYLHSDTQLGQKVWQREGRGESDGDSMMEKMAYVRWMRMCR